MLTPVAHTPSPLRRLSPGAAEGWRAFCAREGLTQTALAEVIGLELARIAEDERSTPSFLRTLVAEARRIAAERRER